MEEVVNVAYIHAFMLLKLEGIVLHHTAYIT